MRYLAILSIFLALPVNSFSATCKLAWDAPASMSPTDIAGYNVYRSTTSGSNYSKVNSAVVTVLPTNTSPYLDSTVPDNGRTYYYVIRTVAVGGRESGNSNEVPFDAPVGVPQNNRIVP